VKISQIRTLSVERIGRQLARAAAKELSQIIEGLTKTSVTDRRRIM